MSTVLPRRTRWIVLFLVVAGLGAGGWWWFTRDRPRYEAAFPDFVRITVPPGLRFEERGRVTEPIDRYLRAEKVGYVSGVLGRGDPSQVESIELGIELDGVSVESLVRTLEAEGWLPAGSSYQAGRFPVGE